MTTLGEKIRALRKMAGISQFNMETDLKFAFGSLSRIELDRTTPTRVTICKIADYLKLNDREFDYLIGSKSNVPTRKEIEYAKKTTQELWDSETILAILRDDRFRVCAASKAIKKIFNITPKIWKEYCYLHNITSVMLNPNLPFHKAFDPNLNPDAEKDLFNVLVGFYYEMSYMPNEPDYIKTVETISQNALANKLWNKLLKTKDYPTFYLIDRRQLKVFFNNTVVDLVFYTETLPHAERFSFLHFFPKPTNFI